MIKVAINGFGRIGRSAFKVALTHHKDKVEVVAINDLTDTKTLAHLLKYDSNYGQFWGEVNSTEDAIWVDGREYKVFAKKDPTELPWKDLQIDVVIESTGLFTSEEKSRSHLNAGAKRVVISAPSKGGNVGTYVLGVNKYIDGQEMGASGIINNASCTTNCITPVAAVMQAKFGVAKALMSTIHAYTQDQRLQDAPHEDLRRARAAQSSIIPTTTGAAIATTEVIEELKGLFDGVSFRVPVAVGSVSDITFLLKKQTTKGEVNEALSTAAQNPIYRGILAVTDEPIVSTDIVGRTESAIVDLALTQVVGGDLVKVVAWYDNEWGYSNRLVEQVIIVGEQISI